jgi:hypothetical protein
MVTPATAAPRRAMSALGETMRLRIRTLSAAARRTKNARAFAARIPEWRSSKASVLFMAQLRPLCSIHAELRIAF